MAEAEDVVTDVARHATVFAQNLWQRHWRKKAGTAAGSMPGLDDAVRRLDLLVAGVFGRSYAIRAAREPVGPTWVARLFRGADSIRPWQSVPATDGASIWLPAAAPDVDPAGALDRYRTCVLQQAMRAHRGSAAQQPESIDKPLEDAYLLMEAHAADEALARKLPGLAAAINRLRRDALARRPALGSFALNRRPFELAVRSLLQSDCGRSPREFPVCDLPAESFEAALRLLHHLPAEGSPAPGRTGSWLLYRDWWTGDLRRPEGNRPAAPSCESSAPAAGEGDKHPQSARLLRSPRVRRADTEEDDERQGSFMIQTAQPHEHAEDPAGMQRPTDRDNETGAEDFADSLADLPEARMVTGPGRPKEILLSEDELAPHARHDERSAGLAKQGLAYPEWDYRIDSYRLPGATVRLLPAGLGPQQWVDETLVRYRSLQQTIRRRFEMLRADPVRLHRQLEGEEIDLEACVGAHADFRAGLPMAQALYRSRRRERRSMAIMLLIDVSGSTDAWVGANRRVIDVEREALLLVCLALDSMGEPYSILAFSGEGPSGVSMRSIKSFDEPSSPLVARRIASLEPEQYTRAGAAIRHAGTLLMAKPAAHRLLLLLSDGKPNDVDVYEGRYGVEDTRMAVTEAKMQGMSPFCLTVDRQASDYLPGVFGVRQYALMPRPELLPTVLLDWIKRLVSA